MRVRALAVSAAILALSSVTGCGRGGDDVPSPAGVARELESRGMEPELAACLGRAYEAAGFTADHLRTAGADGIDPDDDRYREFATRARDCASTDISVPTAGP